MWLKGDVRNIFTTAGTPQLKPSNPTLLVARVTPS